MDGILWFAAGVLLILLLATFLAISLLYKWISDLTNEALVLQERMNSAYSRMNNLEIFINSFKTYKESL
ncbi:hypothetical protein CUJ83_03105 [Methanocella sp. CWC-04]|uniref:Uncharacterized protein n=1 Tax=Methanooceanicella nereidis TaxID=2052831 RepID=A0AAP2W559_9EURY|nr:hypothetical protein [Methanocella sp. CWC-04]MCD1293983.1 hypothetical protein [Methanocella sp. CWC-04]